MGTWESRSTRVQYVITIDHAAEQWSARDLTNQIDASYQDGLLMVGTERSPSPSYRARVTNTPLQLLFPERLPVWGRGARDTDTPIETSALDADNTLVVLRSNSDPAVRKTMVVNDRLGMITRYYDTLTVTVLEDITPF